MKDTFIMLTGKDYLSAVCDIHLWKAIGSFCLTVMLSIFGEDHTGIMVLGVLWVLDTVTGMLYAVRTGTYKSGIGFVKGGIKLYVIGVSFLTMSLLAMVYPELSIAPNLTASFFILNEAYSILENVNKLYPHPYLSALLAFLGSAEARITEAISSLKIK